MAWYFDTREGIMGPYRTESAGRQALDNHLDYCKRFQVDGGRRLGLRVQKLALADF
jgi:hypothetical protein